MKISIDTTFNTREELDSFIRSRVGDNLQENIKHEVEMTADEAQSLSLDENTKVYGVRIVII